MLALQAEAAQRWTIQPPFEVTVAVRNTGGATLGGFAQGWSEPGHGLWNLAACLDDHVLLRREIDGPIDPEECAIAIGDRLEQAFGTMQRRHLCQAGDHVGQFDPRFFH